MPAPDLGFALSLPPKKAIEWLESKKVTAESYRNLTASEIAKVYTIARMTDLDMLNDIKTSMVESAKSGQSYSDWCKGILNLLSNKGWLHPNGHNGKDIIDPMTGEVFGAPRRLETIYRTNMQTAYNAEQYQGYMANVDARPYWMYDSVGDSRTRPAHAAMDWCIGTMTLSGRLFTRQTATTAAARSLLYQRAMSTGRGGLSGKARRTILLRPIKSTIRKATLI